MSSTNRGYDRHKSDYYITPQDQIELFLNEFVKVETGLAEPYFSFNILDPCAGGDEAHEMSYPESIKNSKICENIITTIDIREDRRALIKGDYLKLDCKNTFSIIITNPPFNIAIDIIKKAIDDVLDDGFVIMLLRLNFLGSKQRFEFWKDNMPKYVFVHHKRMSFTENGNTDSIEYAHFVWQKGNRDDTKLFVI